MAEYRWRERLAQGVIECLAEPGPQSGDIAERVVTLIRRETGVLDARVRPVGHTEPASVQDSCAVAVVSLALEAAGTTVGYLDLFEGDQAPLSTDDIEFVARICAPLGSVLMPRREPGIELSTRLRDFAALADQLRVGVFVDSHDGRPLYANSAAARLIGYTAAELRAMPVHERNAIFEDTDRFLELLVRDGRVRGFKSTAKRKDGTRFEILANGAIVRNARGEVELEVATYEDISVWQGTMLDIENAERKFAPVFQVALGMLSLSRSPEATVVEINESFCRFAGLTREEVIGRRIDELDLWAVPEQKQRFEAQMRTKGFAHACEVTCRRKDGSVAHGLLDATTFDFAGKMYVLAGGIDITERKRAEADLSMVMSAVEAAPNAAYWADPDGRVVYVNPTGYRALGYSREEMQAMHVSVFDLGVPREDWGQIWRKLRETKSRISESEYRRKDGTVFPVEVTVTHFVNDEKEYCHAYVKDLTEERRAKAERKALEVQLEQAHKMESIGRLAGGVAHDFNNMLGVILGQAELSLSELPADAPMRADLEEIRGAAQRSAELTRQLLAFARRQTAEPKVLDLNTKVRGMLNMLRRLIGENIDLRFHPEDALWRVRIDPSQVDQILANLCANSRDAICGTGTITITTSNFSGREGVAAAALSGDYVRIAVADSGNGISEEVLPHLFEPFFTTKEKGKGTGLGLASVYGIVTQNGGAVDVQSSPGNGTTITVLLPRCTVEDLTDDAAKETTIHAAQGNELILLVEDDPTLREIERRMLRQLGYTVLVAHTPRQAIDIVGRQQTRINLLVSDIIMPEMNGLELAERIAQSCPEMATLFVSGYPADVTGADGVVAPGIHFLEKPFSVEAFSKKIREALRSTPGNG